MKFTAKALTMLALACGAIPASASETTTPTPIGSPGDWISASDYPSSELMREATGITHVRLLVDKAGGVADCFITTSSGSEALDATACALLKARARFNPAKDRNGAPVSGFWSSAVRWVIPENQPSRVLDGKWDVSVTVTLSEAGLVESCDFTSAGLEIPPNPNGVTPCTGFPVGMKMEAFVDSDGKPIRVRLVTRNISGVEIIRP